MTHKLFEHLPDWQPTFRDDGDSEVEEHGVSSIVSLAQTPLPPERFHDRLNRNGNGVLRSKGFFWLATRLDKIGV